MSDPAPKEWRGGVNQRGEVVIEFRRAFVIYRRSANAARPLFPTVTGDWTA